jgi:hypothetical protein
MLPALVAISQEEHMNNDFDLSKFQVDNRLKKVTPPTLSLRTDGHVRFNRSAIELFDERPEAVLFLINREASQIAIKAASREESPIHLTYRGDRGDAATSRSVPLFEELVEQVKAKQFRVEKVGSDVLLLQYV